MPGTEKEEEYMMVLVSHVYKQNNWNIGHVSLFVSKGFAKQRSYMDIPIIKRLHISGLTPALTSADVSKKLSSFGTVNELDGFGLLNGVNQPRNYGFVTIESTASKLAKCE
jgi:hypothetical protein